MIDKFLIPLKPFISVCRLCYGEKRTDIGWYVQTASFHAVDFKKK